MQVGSVQVGSVQVGSVQVGSMQVGSGGRGCAAGGTFEAHARTPTSGWDASAPASGPMAAT